MPGHSPSLTSSSLWQMPQASTLMRTWPRAGSGVGRSTTSKFPLGLLTWTAFMGEPLSWVVFGRTGDCRRSSPEGSCELLPFIDQNAVGRDAGKVVGLVDHSIKSLRIRLHSSESLVAEC